MSGSETMALYRLGPACTFAPPAGSFGAGAADAFDGERSFVAGVVSVSFDFCAVLVAFAVRAVPLMSFAVRAAS
ncbi:hypothetical protein BDY17DRAFT_305468 [Neohortaea acidophila]|uniref:Uncharacterized protein n=1 Tax=Neohortaea acidophila TaxID=245834 RepID=A0A6A6PFR5_9PEZI|nr:uncharacterized protein BDY17DRAFT_305468 [Neohortaea acidophila]KAF2478596.1 hypothetical protein BDY17DRAFT_305468 [Neohortaea acidophila]